MYANSLIVLSGDEMIEDQVPMAKANHSAATRGDGKTHTSDAAANVDQKYPSMPADVQTIGTAAPDQAETRHLVASTAQNSTNTAHIAQNEGYPLSQTDGAGNQVHLRPSANGRYSPSCSDSSLEVHPGSDSPSNHVQRGKEARCKDHDISTGYIIPSQYLRPLAPAERTRAAVGPSYEPQEPYKYYPELQISDDEGSEDKGGEDKGSKNGGKGPRP